MSDIKTLPGEIAKEIGKRLLIIAGAITLVTILAGKRFGKK
jgi:hypothetical protein